MANANEPKKSSGKETSFFKSAFQYATAALSCLTGENPNTGFQNAGFTYEYAKAYVGSKRKPQF
ncbi:MAG: hypothetical protein GC185_08015 [Alphaproteobacteria bacterium]|nr:hypothetical protein [Alphaproteobacteria bacterium]